MKGARLSSTKSPSGGWATLRRSPRPYFGCARRTRPSPLDTPWSSTAARPPERPDDCLRPRKEQQDLRRERQVGRAVWPPEHIRQVADSLMRLQTDQLYLWQSIRPSSAYSWLVSVPAPLYSSSLTCSPQ